MSYKLAAPPVYTEEQLNVAIDMASRGEPLKRIIDEICSTELAFWLYRQHYPEYANTFEQARQEGLEHLADGLITAHEDLVDVQRARLKSDNAKWLLSKRKPSVYGDKVDIHVSQTIDITGALSEARARALIGSSTQPDDIDITPADAQSIIKSDT